MSTYKFSLESLLDRTREADASEAAVAKARASLTSPEHDPDAISNSTAEDASSEEEDAGVDQEDLLASVVGGDAGETGELRKIQHAMKRTEALRRPQTWYFFKPSMNHDIRPRRPFPEESLSKSGWQAMLRDPVLRQQAFLTGLAAQMSSHDDPVPDSDDMRDEKKQGDDFLPKEVYQWMLEELCVEPRDDLRMAYLSVIRSHAEQVSELLDPVRIDSLFRLLGATDEAVKTRKPIHPSSDFQSNERGRDWTRVISLVQMLEAVASRLSIISVQHVLCILSRLTIDSNIIHATDLIRSIGITMTSLSEGMSGHEWETTITIVTGTLTFSIVHPTSRLQLLECLPTGTTRTHNFRSRLAISFFYNSYPTYSTSHDSTLLTIRSVTKHLQFLDQHKNHPKRQLETDYAALACVISTLDIGLDACIPSSFTHSTHSTPSQQKLNRMEQEYNQEIDILATQIKGMFTRISDTGASHMTRTEAKEVLNRVYYRLIYSVRTKPRPKKNLFMGGSSSYEDQYADDDDKEHVEVDGKVPEGRVGDGRGGGGPLMKYFVKTKREIEKKEEGDDMKE
ncbi:MAG: hypothetical protein M1823_000319 [Watsoniomyces obsoletus]|nr:MAG: hypothetical protein M1823_000319 [Watsoniomyces obsoletus]